MAPTLRPGQRSGSAREAARDPQPPGATGRRAPQECPVCAAELRVTALGCPSCGTGISGDFEQCQFCALDARDLDVLKVFLAARGNLRELERHLQVSYPTARARFDDVIRRLGLATALAEPVGEPVTQPSTGPAAAVPDQRLDTLRALASGDLDVDAARKILDPGQ